MSLDKTTYALFAPGLAVRSTRESDVLEAQHSKAATVKAVSHSFSANQITCCKYLSHSEQISLMITFTLWFDKIWWPLQVVKMKLIWLRRLIAVHIERVLEQLLSRAKICLFEWHYIPIHTRTRLWSCFLSPDPPPLPLPKCQSTL